MSGIRVAMLAGLAAAGMMATVQRPRSEEDWGDPLGIKETSNLTAYGIDKAAPVPRARYRRPGTSKYTPHVGAKQQAKGLKALERQRAKEGGA
jgi:hypothetical protein